MGLIGVGQAEAFQLLFNAGGIFYAITYVVMFAIPLFGLRGLETAPPRWLKLLSLSGLLMTGLCVILSVFLKRQRNMQGAGLPNLVKMLVNVR